MAVSLLNESEYTPLTGLAWSGYFILWGAGPKPHIEEYHSDVIIARTPQCRWTQLTTRAQPPFQQGPRDAESGRPDVDCVLQIPTDSYGAQPQDREIANKLSFQSIDSHKTLKALQYYYKFHMRPFVNLSAISAQLPFQPMSCSLPSLYSVLQPLQPLLSFCQEFSSSITTIPLG